MTWPRNIAASDTNLMYVIAPTSTVQYLPWVFDNNIYFYIFFIFFKGSIWRTASRAPSDSTATQSGSPICPRPELASPTWETHLWILQLWSQCTFTTFSLIKEILFSWTWTLSFTSVIFPFSIWVPCLLRIYVVLSPRRMLVPKCGYVLLPSQGTNKTFCL